MINPLGVPDSSSFDLGNPQNTSGLNNGQTLGNGQQANSEIAQLRETVGAMQVRQAELERQLQSTGDTLFARVMGKVNKNAQAIRMAGELKGADEATIQADIKSANEKILFGLSAQELEQLNQTPAPQLNQPQNPPQGPTDNAAHAMLLRNTLMQMGLTEADLGEGGIAPYIGKPDGSPEAARWQQLTGNAIRRKQALASQVSQNMAREMDAQQMYQAAMQTGGLGATTGGFAQGGSAEIQNAMRLYQQELEKYRGTGKIAEVAALKREFQARYGVELPGQK